MTGHRDGGRKTSRGCVSPSEGGPGTPGGGVSASFKETAVKREKGDFIKERFCQSRFSVQLHFLVPRNSLACFFSLIFIL